MQIRISWVQYLDELLAIAFLGIYTVKVIRTRKIQLGSVLIFADLLLILAVGLAGNKLNSSQAAGAVVQDIFLCLKFALMYVTAANIFDVLDKEKMRAWGTRAVEIFTVFLGIIAILDMVFHIFPTPDFRYGFYSRMLFFSHPTYYSACLIQLCIVYIICSKELNRRAMLILGVLSFLTLTTLRSKAIATGFEIANTYFPLGTGFGTYATYASGVYYSNVYRKFHLEQIYGLGEDNLLFVSDSFWPAILGQFGYLGTMLYVILIVLIFAYCMAKTKDIKGKSVVYFCAAYLLILSIAESSFFNPMAVGVFYILAAFI